MLMTLEEVQEHIEGIEEEELEMRLEALELFIQGYTHNDFADKNGSTEYPVLVKLGAINLLKYDLATADKSREDVASETISRHSVSYKDRALNVDGYPKNLLAFLKPYKKARF